MSIELHCPQCSKLIRAPDNAGGRHGKCPYCKREVYIPMAASDAEEIAIAPFDDDADRLAREMEEEARELATQLRRAKDVPAEEPARSAKATASPPEASIEIAPLVVRFVKCMRDSQLDQAERLAGQLKTAPDRTREEVQRLMVDEMQAPGLEEVPPALYKGFLKALLERL